MVVPLLNLALLYFLAFADWPREKNVSFLNPRLVAQVSYSEITSDVKVRQAVFLGLRDDKSAKDIRTPGSSET